LLSPDLIRYIIDPENTSEIEEQQENSGQKQFLKPNSVDLGKIKEDCSFFRALAMRMKSALYNNKSLELKEQE